MSGHGLTGIADDIYLDVDTVHKQSNSHKIYLSALPFPFTLLLISGLSVLLAMIVM